jgi:hypothetical protein
VPEVTPSEPGAELNVLKLVAGELLSVKVNPVEPGVAAVKVIVEEFRLAVTALFAAVIELAHL